MIKILLESSMWQTKENYNHMKHILLITIALMFLISCAKEAKETTVTIQVDNPKAHVVVEVQGHRYKVKLDSTAYGEQVITLEKGTYAKIIYGRTQSDCYLSNGNTLHANYKKVKNYAFFTLECEDGGMNTYLMDSRSFKYGWNEGETNEEQFLNSYDSRVDNAVAKVLNNPDFPQEFKTIEAERFKYLTAGVLLNYPRRHRGYMSENGNYVPTKAYTDKLRSLLLEKPELMSFDVYKNYITRATQVIVSLENTDGDAMRVTEQSINLAVELFKDQKIQEFLVNAYATNVISYMGVAGTDAILKQFKTYVTDSTLTSRMDALISKWNKIAVGQPSPTFTYEDINGQMVALSSLKGKYVYIDCWATWCGPCCNEIPHLQKLEHDYANKNIHFVSISSDKNKQAWMNMVKKDKLGGIQLFRGDDRSFSKTFMISGIPRFILLDKEGCIVDAHAPRPSDDKTRVLFDGLEGI